MDPKSAGDAFATRRFQSWKLATTVFCQNELSAFHKEAVERVYNYTSRSNDEHQCRTKLLRIFPVMNDSAWDNQEVQ